jgi:hypothetical protein
MALLAPGDGERAAVYLRKSVDLWRIASKRCPLCVEFATKAQEAENALNRLP